MRKKTQLYRHFDADRNLLYVGVTSNIDVRNASHKVNSHWFSAIDIIESEEFPDRSSAVAAELSAIKEESPKWNVIGNPNAIAGQPRNMDMMTIRIPLELMLDLKLTAKADDRSINSMVTRILRECMEDGK